MYCSREKSSVTLIGTPAKIASSIAGSPSLVPGILMKRFGLPARACRSLATASVVLVSCASSGDTSSDTQPSTPRVRSKTGRNRSAARVTSSSASSKNSASPDLPRLEFAANRGVVVAAVLDRVVEDGRIRCQSRDRKVADVMLERAAFEQVARDVVEPEALADVMELACRVHRFASFGWMAMMEGFGAAWDGLAAPRKSVSIILQVIRRYGRASGHLIPQTDHGLRPVVVVSDCAKRAGAEGKVAARRCILADPACRQDAQEMPR